MSPDGRCRLHLSGCMDTNNSFGYRHNLLRYETSEL